MRQARRSIGIEEPNMQETLHADTSSPQHTEPRFIKFLNIGIVAAILVVVVIFIGLRLFSFNALAVYLDDRFVGYIAFDRTLTSEEFHNEAIEFNSMRFGDIRTTQRITVVPARWVAARDISVRSEVFNSISFYLDYNIMARAIYVNGNRKGLVRSDQYVNQIILLMTQRFRTENTVHYEFTADWDVRHVLVDPEVDIPLSTIEIIDVLDRNIRVHYPYVVQPGDTWESIATLFGTYAAALASLNGTTENSIIHSGQTLYVNTFRPLLSVVTIDKVTTIEEIVPGEIVLTNPDLSEYEFYILERGTGGERRVTQLVTYVNGVPRGSPEIVEEEILRIPTPSIIEVGIQE